MNMRRMLREKKRYDILEAESRFNKTGDKNRGEVRFKFSK